jgi:hypothetical protein
MGVPLLRGFAAEAIRTHVSGFLLIIRLIESLNKPVISPDDLWSPPG